MQWILQDFEDTHALAAVLERVGLSHSVHKVVPFVGELIPEPVIGDPNRVVLFGSYSLHRFAARKGLSPGVFTLRPFVGESAWRPHLLNGPDALFLSVRDIPSQLSADGPTWFVRPVDDSKAVAGRVLAAGEIIAMARNVLALGPHEIPAGALSHDTAMMLSRPVTILKEWRLWVVGDRVVTASLYKEGARVVYRAELDDDALDFARELVALNPTYAPAYVMDVCRTGDGLRLLETNCINAAGFYAADLFRLVQAVEDLEVAR